MNVLNLIGRKTDLFGPDLSDYELDLKRAVEGANFLVLGGAGSIGQAVTKEIFKRSPQKLHVVDVSENNLVELVRDVRSEYGYIQGDFQTFALDIGSIEFDVFFDSDGQYDYILNLSALKHVRSEKDPYTLMRMIDVNIFNTDKTVQQAINANVKKYFCVSTDKAANPVNMMGASKKIMELFLMRRSVDIEISTARFANVIFSDGSLLHGFSQRIEKRQPIVAPADVQRYFLTPQEAGELCLMSCILGENRDIFFPKLTASLDLVSFTDIAIKFLTSRGYTAHLCQSEEEARALVKSLPEKGKWPCLFTRSDTTGEKSIEEFFTMRETVDMNRFKNLGVIKNKATFDEEKLIMFQDSIKLMKQNLKWDKPDLVNLFNSMLSDFNHQETGKYLDSKM